MQNYGQAPTYQRPGSTASFAGHQTAPSPPPPPAYGGYQSAAPQNQSQWAPPGQNNQPSNQPWNQPQQQQQQQQQQAAGGYNPGIYGAMPGGQQAQPIYPPQSHDQPPPPPPKPVGFVGAVQQQQQQQQQQNQGWPQQPQQTPQQQGGYPVQGGSQNQQQYNNAAPPPLSATPEGSYFPPPQGGRPGSIYGANQSAGPQQSTVISPNEQQPVYIPPSLSGQGVQAYMPSNTNPMPGVYVPPPPDVPAWQQAQHAPLQGGSKKFRYTKPTVDSSFYAQGYQGVQPMQPPPPPSQYVQSPVQPQQPQQPFGMQPHNQYVPQGQVPQQPLGIPNQFPQQPSTGQQSQSQPQPYGQPYGQPMQQAQQPSLGYQPQQQQVYGQPIQQPSQFQPQSAPQPPHDPNLHGQQIQPPPPAASNLSKQHNQLPDIPTPAHQNYGQYQQNGQNLPESQPQWQPQQSETSLGGASYAPATGQDIQAPKPLARTDTASSNFFNQASPQSQPVSPVNHRNSMSFNSNQQAGLGRTASVGSIALANLQAQREGNRTGSPRPPPPKLPTPPPPRDDKSRFSALGTGGPSDWEHFGGDVEIDDEEMFAKKELPAQLDSVELPASHPELPAGPSPPSTHGWPSPATQPAPLAPSGRKDTYQPTPPPVIASLAERPMSQPPQQSYVMGDAAPAPLSISPKPFQGARPPSTQQSFVMGDGAWQPPKQSTPSQQRSQYQPPSVATGFTVGDGSWGAAQQTPTQNSSDWESQQNQQHAAELTKKDEVFERLRVEMEKEKANLQAEIQRLQVDIESVRKQAADENAVLQEQLETMKITTEQIEATKTAAEEARANAEAEVKEKNLTIERMKEDVEGKEHNIEERDAIITALRRELDAEKAKESIRIPPIPADLIPDINPWYASSLERYITMLRGEDSEVQVEDKIKTFRAFVKTEAGIRGIEFYDAPPPAPAPENTVLAADASNPSRRSAGGEDLTLQMPKPAPDLDEEDDYDISPGGRPAPKRKATMPSGEIMPHPQVPSSSSQSTTILTPTSSVDDDMNTTPIQPSLDEEPQQYKAYVPPALFSHESTTSAHRQPNPCVQAPAQLVSSTSQSFEQRPIISTSSSKHHDEIFFGAHGPEKPASANRSLSSDSTTPSVSVPAPLTLSPNRSKSTAPPSRKDPADTLADLLPTEVVPPTFNRFIEEIKTKLANLKEESSNNESLTKQWEQTAAVSRKKNDAARRKRQEENEEINDDAFNNNEISYADLNVLEEEFKEQEGGRKAQEDRIEYKTYVEAVFDPVYNSLQSDIKALVDLYIEAENLLHTSVSGIRSLEPTNDAPSTEASLALLQDIQKRILSRQNAVVLAVAERDKRYKKTETQPLYASGNIAQMRTVEKQFENAEKQALVRAKRDEAAQIGTLVSNAEEVVIAAVGTEQQEMDAILDALRALDTTNANANATLVPRAHATLTFLQKSSKALCSVFRDMEIAHNAAHLGAEIAAAQADNAGPARIKQLEEERAAGEKKFQEEYLRRVEVVEQDGEEIEALVGEKGGSGGDGEEVERERRMKAALEEAKRRNGHA
ncbi:hypothetical protein GQ44DRAFT_822385 [Phaeosphaeriaceae sp. PMI808]|nr:hypothetical protein GQ44DRAFT_822385 [Phaeosphaeriaceae sp. PMI808]